MITADKRYASLLHKLIDVSGDLCAYLRLHKAKGYMSVSENDRLREKLFGLCREVRECASCVNSPQEQEALNLAAGAIASAAVCLMSGHHDCPAYISVNAEKLERCLAGLTECIHRINHSAPVPRS